MWLLSSEKVDRVHASAVKIVRPGQGTVKLQRGPAGSTTSRCARSERGSGAKVRAPLRIDHAFGWRGSEHRHASAQGRTGTTTRGFQAGYLYTRRNFTGFMAGRMRPDRQWVVVRQLLPSVLCRQAPSRAIAPRRTARPGHESDDVPALSSAPELDWRSTQPFDEHSGTPEAGVARNTTTRRVVWPPTVIAPPAPRTRLPRTGSDEVLSRRRKRTGDRAAYSMGPRLVQAKERSR